MPSSNCRHRFNSWYYTRCALPVPGLLFLLGVMPCLAQFSIVPLAGFGSNGWLAPNGVNGSTYTYLTVNDTERGLAYGNNHLYLVSRNGGDFVRVLDPHSGADLGALNLGSGIVGGGTFDVNVAAVGGDGAVYVCNLAIAPASFVVYRWANDLATTTPTVVYINIPLAGGRAGDSLAAIGSGLSTRLAAGFNNIPAVTGDNGYAIIDPNSGSATAVSFSGALPAAGDFRLAISFIDSNHVIGTQGGSGSAPRYTTFSGSTGTLLASPALASTDERPMSFAVIAGFPLLAALSTTDNHVSLYDMTDPTQPVLVGQANATVGTLPVDSHNTGALTWGQISGNTATLYAMATDDGIQAFTVTVPAPIPAAILSQPQSQTAGELMPATFSVGAGGYPAPSYQWYRGDSALPGATASSYVIGSAAYTDNGAQFKVVVQNVITNVTWAVTSSVVSLTVIADTNPPVLLGAQALGLTQVQATFSERLSPASATNLANYALASTNGALVISNAILDVSQTNVILTTATLGEGLLYTLTVNNVTDQSHAANVIAPNSQARFLASLYTLVSIGNGIAANQVAAGNGYNIAAGGAGTFSTNDQCALSYELRSGDFDIAARVDSLDLADAWSEAGLMAREDPTPGARFVSALATPSISGAFFQWRNGTNGISSRSGSLPVNYPNMWLRLKRSGSSFSGFGSYDGQNWSALGSVNVAMAPNLYVGFVVASANTNRPTSAAFRDFGPVSGVGTAGVPPMEGLGQGSRSTSLVISEVMYHPTNSTLEFVELFNSRAEPQDLSGYQLGGNIAYTFPAGSSIAGGGFVVVAASPISLQAAYGLSQVFGPYTGHLPGSQGVITLVSQGGGRLLELQYGSNYPWPVSADGAGHSLVLARPSYGVDNVLAWAASDAVGGSPGKLDPVTVTPLRNVSINEFLARTAPPDYNYIELYNHSAAPVDVSGCILADHTLTNRFVIPPGTVMGPHGFLVYTEANLNFALNAGGETLYLKDPAQRRVLDAVRFGGQETGVSMGRYPDGGEQFYRLATKSPGAPNGPIRQADVVINELMYAPVSLNDDDQYVELYNRSALPIDLGGWQFVSGITFTFPAGVVVQPDGYMVVARNAARLQTNYPNLNSGNLIGNFGGTLSHKGEHLALAKPDTIVVTNTLGVATTNAIRIVVNELSYGVGGRWGELSHGGGSSLELIDPHADNALAPNWADSDETHKAPWTTVSATGTIDNGDVAADELQVLLQGVGEALVDNVQVIDNAGNNRIANGTFESGAGGWAAEGTEKTSSLETTEGYNSAQSYHLRAVEKGDNQINRVRTLLTSPLAAGTTNVTIRAAVRWLKGDPEILLRLRGNWLECAAELPTPANLGTPGMRNSRYVSNAPPAIVDVKHAPVLPQAGQAILVTARVSDPDGVSAVVLKYRLDPSTTYATVTMTDNGTGGDAVAGDGEYSATIPGQAAGTMVAFFVQATDGAGIPATSKFPNDAPARECLARVGEVQPTGNYPVYRVWMTQSTLNTWNANSRLDNSFYDFTFVLGDKRVIYNAGGRFKGSPYISPGYCGVTCGRCGYSFTFPADDLFLGEADLVIDWPGGHGGETTALQEQMCYWIADRLNLPWSHRHTIRLHINGVTDDMRQATFEAVVQPAGGFIREWSPADSSGELFKIERAFEFNDSGGLTADPEPRLQLFTTTGGRKKTEHYRWNFMFRATDRRDDYTNILALVDAVNAAAPEPYTSATLGLVDMEEWMGAFATEHIIENFDAYGHEIGKNMYAYLAPSGKWQLYIFDLDWAMLAAPNYSSIYTASAGPLFNSEDPTITRMYGFAPFVRAYWRAVQNAVNGPFDPANCYPVIDAKSRALFANGIQWCDGQPLTEPSAVKNWFSQRRAALQTQLASVAAPFSVTSLSISNNIALVTGTAPVAVQRILFNGSAWPLTWTSVTGWAMTVPLSPGTNQWSVVGVDPQGVPIPGASNSVSAVYSGTIVSAVGQVVINEIMYNPPVAGAQYVELYNTSSSFSFDLSAWQLKGLAYTFPAGSLIRPNQYLVLAANRAAFAGAYGATNLVFDTFNGTLQPGGETLTLLQPGTNGLPGPIVSRVRYSSGAPWPSQANGTGTALQLIDAHQDNWRVGNWAAASTNQPGNLAPQWTYFSTTGLASSSRLNIYLLTPGMGYVDDIKLVAGSVAEVGINLLTNGDFETSLAGSWNMGSDFNLSDLTTLVRHGGNSSLEIVGTSAGNSTNGDAVYQDISPGLVLGQPYTLSFWYLQTTNTSAPALTIELSGRGLTSGTINPALAGPPQAFAVATPGAANGDAAVLPAFPPLWINELQAENLNGITNLAGQRSGWLELYNPTTNIVALGGLYLSTNYSSLASWALPAGATINPGQFLVVFADGQGALSSSNELHAGFTLGHGAGSLALSRVFNNQPQVLDYIDYTNVAPNHSYGSIPDGQSFDRQEFAIVTPGAANIATNPPSFIPYTAPGEVYSQSFDALPDPGLTSVNTANPVTISGITYALGNPFDFAGPVLSTGGGGLGLAGLSGWYGLGSLTSKFGATDGDQTTGGVISFGLPASSNRALGLLATSSTGATAFGARFINQTGKSLSYLNLQFTAELWRQSNLPKTLLFFYSIDPSGMAPFSPAVTAFVPSLNVSFATNPMAVGGVPVDGTAPANQIHLSALGQVITNWPPGAALFLLWEMADATGKAQGLAIDNLQFSASDQPPGSSGPPLGVRVAGGNLVLSWTGLPGQSYQIEYKDDLEASTWTALDTPMVGTGATLSVTNILGSAPQRFYRLAVLP